MAFLINAYNAFTVEMILTRLPREVDQGLRQRLFGNRVKDEFFTLFGQDCRSTDRARACCARRAPTTSRACTSR
jgi:hypothetical protein